MRPLQLEMQEFVSYQKEIIDFEQHTAEGIFLICGVTGAGKTGLLDAICFALYGSSSGGERDAKMLRRLQAAPELETKVSLSFSLHNLRYFVERRPEQERPAKGNRDRLVKAKPEAELYQEINGSKELLVEGYENVTKKVEELIGLNSEQFRQIIILPQGSFRQLLLADSKDREKILEKIFMTTQMKKIEDALKEAGQRLKLACDQQISFVQVLWKESGMIAELNIFQWEEQYNQEKAQVYQLLNEGKLELTSFQTTVASLRQKVALLREIQKLIVSLQEAQVKQQELALEQAEILVLEAKVASGKKAEKLQPLYEQGKEQRLKVDDLQKIIAEHEEKLVVLSKHWQKIQASKTQWTATEEKAKRAELAQYAVTLTNWQEKLQAMLVKEALWQENDLLVHKLEQEKAKLEEISNQVTAELKLLEAEQLVELRRQLQTEQSLQLAKSLQANSPCPVCGSLTHPQPAKGEATNNEQQLVAEIETVLAKLPSLKIKREEYTVTERECSKKLQIALQTRGILAGALQESKNSIPVDLQNSNNLGKAYQETKVAVEKNQQLEESLFATWEQTKEDYVQATEKQKGLQAQLAQAKESLLKLRSDFEVKLIAEGFTEKADFILAYQELSSQSGREERIKKHHEQKLLWADRARERASQVAGRTVEELASLEAALILDEEQLQQKIAELAVASEQLRKREEAQIKISAAVAKQINLEQEFSVLGKIADVASGKNPQGVSFGRYVLAALFEDVLVAANQRLSRMSKGRYLLCPTSTRQRINAAGGLDFAVLDQDEGKERSLRTLSGGESFKAALSLALGLTDVVQAYAGGISLETVFIDEGFGSLDEDSLHEAIEILLSLQKSGRMVGIISHVSSLREEIPQLLEIVQGKNGSLAQWKNKNI
ncbi:MAG: SMC family ATPase [Clostridia bacterium]